MKKREKILPQFLAAAMLAGCAALPIPPATEWADTVPPTSQTAPTTLPMPTVETDHTIPSTGIGTIPTTEILPPPTEPAPALPPYTLDVVMEGVTRDMADPGFWVSDGPVRMNTEEIQAFNSALAANPASGIVDLTALPETFDAETVKNQICAYTITLSYLDGAPITQEAIATISGNRNLDSLTEEITPEYGIVVNEANLRSFPTNSVLMDAPDNRDFDYFQETTLKVGEGVAILHRSADSQWLFVQARNYCGWVEARQIARCSREEMTDYITAADFYLVTAPVLLGDIHLPMGTRLPAGENAEVLLPIAENGMLGFAPISREGIELNRGYLDYTQWNVLNQAMKLLNTPYGWGNKGSLLDCSGMILSVYECFGFSLPRNTSAMIACAGENITELAPEEKLQAVAPGSILLFRGHAMLYLGAFDGNAYILHSFGSHYDASGSRLRVMNTTISPLSLLRSSGKTYLETLSTAWDPANTEAL